MIIIIIIIIIIITIFYNEYSYFLLSGVKGTMFTLVF